MARRKKHLTEEEVQAKLDKIASINRENLFYGKAYDRYMEMPFPGFCGASDAYLSDFQEDMEGNLVFSFEFTRFGKIMDVDVRKFEDRWLIFQNNGKPFVRDGEQYAATLCDGPQGLYGRSIEQMKEVVPEGQPFDYTPPGDGVFGHGDAEVTKDDIREFERDLMEMSKDDPEELENGMHDGVGFTGPCGYEDVWLDSVERGFNKPVFNFRLGNSEDGEEIRVIRWGRKWLINDPDGSLRNLDGTPYKETQ